MLSYNFIIPIVLFAISTTFTPGPNNFLLFSSGIKFGLKKTLGHILGITIGFPLMVFIVGVLVSFLVTINQTVFNIFSIIGMTYLLYLGYQIIFSDFIYQENSKAKPITFMQAALFQWINPKAWTMAISASSSFIVLQYNFYEQLVYIVLIFMAVGLCSSTTWALFGSLIKAKLKNSKYIKWINILLGSLLIISIIQMFPEKF